MMPQETPASKETPTALPTASEADIKTCHKAHRLRQKGDTWRDIELDLRFKDASGKTAMKAVDRWIKTCLDQHRCEYCGTKKNHLNLTPLCNQCHDALHLEDKRGIPEQALKIAEQEALDGLNRFLASTFKSEESPK